MKQSKAEVITNQSIAEGFHEMILGMPPEEAETLAHIRPGQFVNLQLPGKYLRRPISICDWNAAEGSLTLIYRMVGEGTRQMAQMRSRDTVDLLWPLGNGYEIPENPEHAIPLLVGGGAGAPPMVGLARCLINRDKTSGPSMPDPVVVLGFRSREEAICLEPFRQMGAEVIVATEDGSMGIKGFVTDAIRQRFGEGSPLGEISLYACGPEAMLRALDRMLPEEAAGQLSFEERMGCGFGACMGCSHETKHGARRICQDGPVLRREEIVW